MSGRAISASPYVFAPDPADVFKACRVDSRSEDGMSLVVSPVAESLTARRHGDGNPASSSSSGHLSTLFVLAGSAGSMTVKASEVTPISEINELLNPPADLVRLSDVHRPGILFTLRQRYAEDQIYSSIGPILIALNPFKWIKGIYEEGVIRAYERGELNLSEQPHVFAVAHDALFGLFGLEGRTSQNQSLIVSGESGSGKTEATKQCLNYLAATCGTSKTSGTSIQTKILQASPVLEAWGNAKTLRNNNSSRFGKFIQVFLDKKSRKISGATNTTYLLEKSRVVFQEKGERNYHIFYQILRGASAEQLEALSLSQISANPALSNYLSRSECLYIDDVDDRADYAAVQEAYGLLGFEPDVPDALSRVLAGILHFGNIDFVENSDDEDVERQKTMISEAGKASLRLASSVLGLDADMLSRCLLFRLVQAGRRASSSYVPLNPFGAVENRDALVKELYSRSFNWIVAEINAKINKSSSGPDDQGAGGEAAMVGVLDIFGFEIFAKNSFEQLCINLTNEALQQHFNRNIFEREMELYTAEGIPVPQLAYKDNADVLDLIMKRPTGIIPLLDEEGRVVKGTWESFLTKSIKEHTGNARFVGKPMQREFAIRHYAGEVSYDPSLFLLKNNDTLSADLMALMSTSSLPFVQDLFTSSPDTTATPAAGLASNAANKQTVGKRFTIELTALIAALNETKPQYIRCIKPNQAKKPDMFVPVLVNEQLTYSGVFEAVIIMQSGYPFRLALGGFFARYYLFSSLLPPDVYRKLFFKIKDERERVVLLLKEAAARTGGEWSDLENCFVGKTLVFFRSPQHRLLESARAAIVGKAAALLNKVLRGGLTRKFVRALKKAVDSCVEAIFSRSSKTIEVALGALQKSAAQILAFSRVSIVSCAEVTSVARSYLDALQTEDRCVAELKVLLDFFRSLSVSGPGAERRMPEVSLMVSHYEQLEKTMTAARSINFDTTFRGKHIFLNWEDNEQLRMATSELSKYELLIGWSKRLDEALSAGNDVDLAATLEDLRNTFPSSPGAAAAKGADADNAAVLAALQPKISIAEAFLAASTKELEACVAQLEERFWAQGGLTLQRKDEGQDAGAPLPLVSMPRTEVEESDGVAGYNVDPRPLEQILNLLRFPRSAGSAGKRQSRVDILLDTLDKVVAMRATALKGDWSTIWRLLAGLSWKSFLGDVVATPTKSFYSYPELFIPAQLASELAEEIKAFFVCALYFLAAPALRIFTAAQSSQLLTRLPEEGRGAAYHAVLAPKPSELETAQEMVVGCGKMLDSRLEALLKACRAHQELRSATVALLAAASKVSIGESSAPPDQNQQLLLTQLESAVKAVAVSADESHPILQSARFAQSYIEAKREVAFLLCSGVASHSESGGFKFQRLPELEQAISRASSVVDADSAWDGSSAAAWKGFLDACSGMLRLRRLLQALPASDPEDADPNAAASLAEAVSAARAVLSLDPFDRAEKVFQDAAQPAAALKRALSRASSASDFASAAFAPLHLLCHAIHEEIMADLREMEHRAALAALKKCIADGAVRGQVGSLDTSTTDTGKDVLKRLEGEWKSSLQRSAAPVPLLLETLPSLLSLRTLVVKQDWVSLIEQALRLYEASESFSKVHKVFRKELLLLLAQAYDVQFHDDLLAALPRERFVLSPDKHLLPQEGADSSLEDLLDKAEMHPILMIADFSDKTTFLLENAQLVHQLRVACLGQHWEYSSRRSSCYSDVSTAEMLRRMGEAALHASSMEAHYVGDMWSWKIDKTFSDIADLEATCAEACSSSRMPKALKPSTPSEHLSVVELLGFAQDRKIHPAIEAELVDFHQAALERRCLLLLHLSVCWGQIRGDVTALDVSSTDYRLLQRAVAFASAVQDTYASTHNGQKEAISATAQNWLEIAQTLLQLRQLLVTMHSSAVEADPHEKPVLRSIPSDSKVAGMDLLGAAKRASPGFPRDELLLTRAFLDDQWAVGSLLSTMAASAPAPLFGEYDLRFVNFSALEAVLLQVTEREQVWLDAANHGAASALLAEPQPAPKSEALQRLAVLSEFCVSLRRVATRPSWRVTESNFSSEMEQEAADELRYYLAHFAELDAYYTSASDKKADPIPAALRREVFVVGMESDKRALKISLIAALKNNTAHGRPLRLYLENVRADELERQLARANQWVQDNAAHADEQLQVLLAQAAVMLRVRSCLVKLQSTYSRDNSFPLPVPGAGFSVADSAKSAQSGVVSFEGSSVATSDLSALREALSGALDEAISRATSMSQQSLRLAPAYQPFLVSDWEPVQQALAALPCTDFVYAEAELLREETVVRRYVGSVSAVLIDLFGFALFAAPENPRQDRGELLRRLRSCNVDYFRSQLVYVGGRSSRRGLASKAQPSKKVHFRPRKPAPLVAFLRDSSVVLFHVLQAHWDSTKALIEPLDRNWRAQDLPAPRLVALYANLGIHHIVPRDAGEKGAEEQQEEQKEQEGQKEQGKSQFTLQAVLRAVGRNFGPSLIEIEHADTEGGSSVASTLHPVVCKVIRAVVIALEDEISCSELLDGLETGRAVVSANVDAEQGGPAVMIDSAAGVSARRLRWALERIDTQRVLLSRPGLRALSLGARIVAELRSSLEDVDIERGFSHLATFLLSGTAEAGAGGPVQLLAAAAIALRRGEFSVHPTVRPEFELLAAAVCELRWQQLSRAAGLLGSVSGSRGELHVDSISWVDVGACVKAHKALPRCSDSSRRLNRVLELLRALRQLIAGPWLVESSDPPLRGQQLFIAVNIDGRGACHFSRVHDGAVSLLASAEMYRLACGFVDVYAPEDVGRFVESLKAESLATTRHNRFVSRRAALEQAMRIPPLFQSPSGLALDHEQEAALRAAIASLQDLAAVKEDVDDSDGLCDEGKPAEAFCARLLAVAEAVDAIASKISSASAAVATPGSELFGSLVPSLSPLIALLDAFCSDHDGESSAASASSGDQQPGALYDWKFLQREKQALPVIVGVARSLSKSAAALVLEHSVVDALRRLISSEQIEVVEERRLVSGSEMVATTAKVRRLSSFPEASDDKVDGAGADNEVDYPQHSARCSAFLARVAGSLSTTSAKTLHAVATHAISLRLAVHDERWADALEAFCLLSHAPDSATHHAQSLEQLGTFLRATAFKRQLWAAMARCTLPPVLGWTSFGSAPQLALEIDDAALLHAVDVCKSLLPVQVTEHPEVAELLFLGRTMLSLVAGLRAAAWNDVDKTSSVLCADGNDDGYEPSGLMLVNSLKRFDERVAPLRALILRHLDAPVAQCMDTLRTALSSSASVWPPIRALLLRELDLLNLEFDVAELEAHASGVLSGVEGMITGAVGSLTPQDGAREAIGGLVDFMEENAAIVDRSYCLKQARLSASLLHALFACIAGDDGDVNRHQLHELVKAYRVALQQPPVVFEFDEAQARCPELTEARTAASALEGWFARTEAAIEGELAGLESKLAACGSFNPFSPGPPPSPHKSSLPVFWRFEQEACFHAQAARLSRLLEAFSESSLAAPNAVPGDLSSLVLPQEAFQELLSVQHHLVECAVVSRKQISAIVTVFRAVREQPQGSQRREVVSKALAQSDFEEAQVLYLTAGVAHELRRAMLTGDLNQLERALDAALTLEVLESLWNGSGSGERQYSAQLAAERRLYTADWDQRRFVQLCEEGLNSGGIAGVARPFDPSRLDLGAMQRPVDVASGAARFCCGGESERAFEATSPEAVRLFETVRVVHEARLLAVAGKWSELLAFLESIDPLPASALADAETEAEVEKPLVPVRLDWRGHLELSRAKDVALVNRALASLTAAAALAPRGEPGDVSLDRQAVEAAERALLHYQLVPDKLLNRLHWCNLNSATTLHILRTHCLAGEWYQAFDYACLALSPRRMPAKPLSAATTAEACLLLLHAAHVIATTALKEAISDCGARGRPGEIDLSHVTCAPLVAALKAAELVSSRSVGLVAHVEGEFVPSLSKDEAEAFGFVLRSGVPQFTAPTTPAALLSSQLHLAATARVCVALRSAQLRNAWFEDEAQEQAGKRTIEGALWDSFVSAAALMGLRASAVPANACAEEGFDADLAREVKARCGEIAEEERRSVEEVLRQARIDQSVSSALQASAESREELALARAELSYRRCVYALLEALHSPGCVGSPGLVDASGVDLGALSAAVALTEREMMAEEGALRRGSVVYLLRDCKLVLRARAARRAQDWSALDAVLDEAKAEHERTLRVIRSLASASASASSSASASASASASGPAGEEKKEEEDEEEEVPMPIVLQAARELQLVRSDLEFLRLLSRFAHELEASSIPARSAAAAAAAAAASSGSTDLDLPGAPSVLRLDLDRAAVLMDLAADVRGAALAAAGLGLIPQDVDGEGSEGPESHFSRLLEAVRTALQVRFFFAYNYRDESPTELMSKVQAVERRDKERGEACFMTLVVPMLTSVGSLVTRKQLVADLHTEVLSGQGYLLSALGCISAPLVDVRGLEKVLDRLEPLLSLPGTTAREKEHTKLARLLLRLRRRVRDHDWGGVGRLLTRKGYALALARYPAAKDEVERLRAEVANNEAHESLMQALQCGRLVDVGALSSLIARHQHRLNELSSSPQPQLAQPPSQEQKEQHHDVDQHQQHQQQEQKEQKQHQQHQQHQRRGSAQRRQSALPASFEVSLALLEESIRQAEGLVLVSDDVAVALHSARILLRLRKAAVLDGWEVARRVASDESLLSARLVPCAREEVRSVQAAFKFRSRISSIVDGLVTGGVTGSRGRVSMRRVDFIPLKLALATAKADLEYLDRATAITFEVASSVCDLRRAIIEGRFFAGDRATNDKSRNMNVNMSMSVGRDKDRFTIHQGEREGEGEEEGDDSVEEVLADLQSDENMALLMELQTLLGIAADEVSPHGLGLGQDDVDVALDQADPSVDWRLLQFRAVMRAMAETDLVADDLHERRGRRALTRALRPPPGLSLLTGSLDAGATEVDAADPFLCSELAAALRLILGPSSAQSSSSSEAEAEEAEAGAEAAEEGPVLVSVPDHLSTESRRLVESAALVLQLRRLLAQPHIDAQAFASLVAEAEEAGAEGRLALSVCGKELAVYGSGAATAVAVRSELSKAMQEGRVGGRLDDLLFPSVQTADLARWTAAARTLLKSRASELGVGRPMQGLLAEAEAVLKVREAVRANDDTALSAALKEAPAVPTIAAAELTHASALAEFRSSRALLERRLERLILGQAQLTSRAVPAAALAAGLPELSSSISRALSFKGELLPADGSALSATAAKHAARLVASAETMIALLRAVEANQWELAELARGAPSSLPPRVQDSLLARFVSLLREHEVGERMREVHSELRHILLEGLVSPSSSPPPPPPLPANDHAGAGAEPEQQEQKQQEQKQEEQEQEEGRETSGPGLAPSASTASRRDRDRDSDSSSIRRTIKRRSITFVSPLSEAGPGPGPGPGPGLGQGLRGDQQPAVALEAWEQRAEGERRDKLLSRRVSLSSAVLPSPGPLLSAAAASAAAVTGRRRGSSSVGESLARLLVFDSDPAPAPAPAPAFAFARGRRLASAAFSSASVSASASAASGSLGLLSVAHIVAATDQALLLPGPLSSLLAARDALVDQTLALRLRCCCLDPAASSSRAASGAGVAVPAESTLLLSRVVSEAGSALYFARSTGHALTLSDSTLAWLSAAQCLRDARAAAAAADEAALAASVERLSSELSHAEFEGCDGLAQEAQVLGELSAEWRAEADLSAALEQLALLPAAAFSSALLVTQAGSALASASKARAQPSSLWLRLRSTASASASASAPVPAAALDAIATVRAISHGTSSSSAHAPLLARHASVRLAALQEAAAVALRAVSSALSGDDWRLGEMRVEAEAALIKGFGEQLTSAVEALFDVLLVVARNEAERTLRATNLLEE